MQPSSPSGQGSIRAPHPLVERLIARAAGHGAMRVLEVGSGNGRNTAALVAADIAHVTLDDAAVREGIAATGSGAFTAAVSTHALLHGSPHEIRTRLEDIAALLVPNGVLYATFGSTRDARFGKGTRIDAATFAPDDGDERGVPHAFFDEAALRALLAPPFTVERIEEVAVDDIAGTWAHPTTPLRGSMHWFVEARLA
jgi:SAM-dependent methyltransferase